LALLFLFLGCGKNSETAQAPSTQPIGSTPEHLIDENPPQRLAPMPRAAPATRPTAPLPANASCITPACHASLASANQIHEPVAKQACDACHGRDVGGHKYPLKLAGNEGCKFCHATVVGTQQHQHKALQDGCLACHSPHVSKAKFLLKADNVEQTCAACHKIPLKRSAHGPFAKGECTLCHQPHQSQFAKLLRGGEGKDHCFSCHGELRKTMNASYMMHKPAVKDCKVCHDPHTSDFPKQLKQQREQLCLSCHEKTKKHIEASSDKHAALVTGTGCTNCHGPHAAPERSLLKARTDRVCFTCHDKPMTAADGHMIDNMKKLMTQSKFLHGANKVGNCNACHDPHGENRRDLLARNFPDSFYARFEVNKYQLCWNCHEKQVVLSAKTISLTNFRNGDQNLHFVTSIATKRPKLQDLSRGSCQRFAQSHGQRSAV
jgi:predicted CXXCH cytochrome family protein